MAAWAAGDHLLPNGLPLGIIGIGVVYGCLNALVAAGMVLIYRANRVLNFAQAELGAVAAVVAIELVLRWHWNYFAAVGAAVLLAISVGAIVEIGIIRRLRHAPRLIVAVATIGLAQVLTGIAILIPLWWSGVTARRFTTPFRVHLSVYPVIFNGDHLMAVVVAVTAIGALGAFLRFSEYGVAIRAAAANPERAAAVGMPVGRLSMVVWAVAGLLSALAVILRVPVSGFASFESVSGGGFRLLLFSLAAAVLGGLTSLPRTTTAAIGLGIVSELGAWTFHDSTYIDALIFGVVLTALLLQRRDQGRPGETGIGSFRALREIRPIPTELRGLPEVRIGMGVAKAVLVVGLVGVPLVATPAQDQLAALVAIYAIVALSLVVLTGWAGHISLGQFALVGFGAATTGTLAAHHGWDLFAALGAGALVGAAAAMIIGLPALRVRGMLLAVTTLAFAVVASSWFLSPRYFSWFVPDTVERPPLWNRLSIASDRQFYYLALTALTVVFVALRGVRHSRPGRALIAARDNQVAAQAYALDTVRLNLAAFALSGGIAGFAGGLYVLHQHGLHTGAFDPDVSLRLFSMVVIGGLGSLSGAVLGAVYIRGAEFFLSAGWAFVVSGAGIVGLLLIAPGGLSEIVYRGRDWVLRRVAERRGLVVPSLLADVRTVSEESRPSANLAFERLSAE